MAILINEKHSIRTQLWVSFLIITLVSIGICLAISLGFTEALAKSSYSNTKNGIDKQTITNAATDASELSQAMAKDLGNIAESICMTLSLQATNFIQNIHPLGGSNYVFPFRKEDSFREYRFTPGCTYPDCPSDYRDLSTLTSLTGWNGSVKHSSVYIYKSKSNTGTGGGPQGPIRTDTHWENVLNTEPLVQPVIDALAYQDASFEEQYSNYPTTVFFYLSVQLCSSTCPSGYTAIHRGFPGTERNTTSYDPPNRSWFRHAPIDAFYLDGPYVETFTQRYVVNLSSRKDLVMPSGGPPNSVVVTGAVLTLDSLSELIRGIAYPNDGFGVLVKYSTQEVLVWRDNMTDIYNHAAGKFYTLSELDPYLGQRDFATSGRTFTYTDGNGDKWLVSGVPFLLTTDFESSNLSRDTPALMVLVYSKWSVATSSLPALSDNIDSTTKQIYFTSGVIAAAIFVVIVGCMSMLISWLTAPLTQIRTILKRIVEISAEEEKNRDYSSIVDVAWFDLHRSDELGCLATTFWYMVMQLHNSCEAKKRRPEYPDNPLYAPSLFTTPPLHQQQHDRGDNGEKKLSDEEDYVNYHSKMEELTAEALLKAYHAAHPAHHDSISSSAARTDSVTPSALPSFTSGDILAQIRSTARVEQVAVSDVGDVELGQMDISNRRGYSAVSTSLPPSAVQQNVSQDQQNNLSRKTCQIITLKVYLSFLAVMLILGLFALMAATVYLLQREGEGWTKETSVTIETAEVTNLDTIASAKSAFIQSYFKQISVDALVLSKAYTTLLDGNWTDGYTPYSQYGLWLTSYALEESNYYRYSLNYMDESNPYISGYFHKDSANCVTAENCRSVQISGLTRNTSLFDMYMSSYFHAESSLSFIQTGQAKEAFTRVLPYSYKTYGAPSTCYIEDVTYDYCRTAYQNSACNPKSTSTIYPPYDPRCRSWYHLALQNTVSTTDVMFQYPRVASSGNLVTTAAVPIRHHRDETGDLHGVLNVNVLADTLSDSVNSFRILTSGYVYLVDAKNISNVVLHPQLTTICTTLRCCESAFSDAEYTTFLDEVLLPLQRALPVAGTKTTLNTYTKDGKLWRFSHEYVTYGTVDYVLMATVSQKDILYLATEVEQDINASNTGIIIAACFVLAFFISAIGYITHILVKSVSEPVNNLIQLCERIIIGDLHHNNIPTQATSLDMSLLLEAFVNMLTALRFGSDTFARGNAQDAMQLFTEALVLYSTTQNRRGIAACHNNLGAVCVSLQRYDEGEQHYATAIQMAEEDLRESLERERRAPVPAPASILTEHDDSAVLRPALVVVDGGEDVERGRDVILDAEPAVPVKDYSPSASSTTASVPQSSSLVLPSSFSAFHLRRLLSDRKGNLALLYAEKGEFAKAFDLLTACMENDRDIQYIRGCVVKQGNMGHLYLKQGEVRSAERIFQSALSFVSEEAAQSGRGALEGTQALVALQIAHYNVAMLKVHQKDLSAAEHHLVFSLCQGSIMHVATTTQALTALLKILQDRQETVKLNNLREIIKTHNLIAMKGGVTSISNKRVAIAIDYSGSMAGSKIKAAVSSLQDLVKKHILPDDMLLLIKFNHSCDVMLPLTMKRGNEERIAQLISEMNAPNGGTALYDAIVSTINAIATRRRIKTSSEVDNEVSSEWVVVLTDGMEGSSRSNTKLTVQEAIGNTSAGVIIIGVGADVDTTELEGLTMCAKNGFFVRAEGNQEGIVTAFGQVAVLMQGQVILEDF